MSTDIDIRNYLHQVLANKAKARLTIEQFDAILKMANQLQKISQKGLLIVALTEELHKISNVNFKSIQKFMNQFIRGLKPEKPKKEPQQRQVRRRRRSRPRDTTNVPKSVDQIAQESLSHPSNLQAGRNVQAVEGKDQESQKISQNESKKSDELARQNLKDFEYANELQKISEGIQYVGMPEFQLGKEPIQQLSKASSSQSFGVVSNFSQKMALLGKEKEEKKTKTAKKGTQATMTKKKQPQSFLIDKNLRLQKTKATMNESFQSDQKSVSYEFSESLEQYYQHGKMHNDSFEEFLTKIKQHTSAGLENFLYSLKKIDEFRPVEGYFETDLTQFETGQLGQTRFDFTSQPIVPEYFQESLGMQELSIFKKETQSPTISEVSMKINQPPAIVFFEMLVKMQKGEIIMRQQNPHKFGQIRVDLVKTE